MLQDEYTPLWAACQNGHVEAAKILIEKGSAKIDHLSKVLMIEKYVTTKKSA